MGGSAQAFVIDNVHEERKQMMGRLEEVERRIAQRGQAPLASPKGDTSGDGKEDLRESYQMGHENPGWKDY